LYARVVQRPVLRLASLVTALGLLALLTATAFPVSRAGLRAALEPFGPWAPPVYVVVAALLALAFVPGPLLSAASGMLFGTVAGFACSVASSVLTAVLALLIARRAGASAVQELSGERARALTELARRRGLLAVVLQRLIPGVPDTPLSYAFGVLGLRVGQMALGTLIGSAPRAFSYTALGDAAATGDRSLAIAATLVGVAVSVVGLIAAGLLTRRRRPTTTPPEPDPEPDQPPASE
jgi:uncharacterized membrane protein YdjX (TVP38/TMEM64 family)